jgi:biopolymer transport protein TolR
MALIDARGGGTEDVMAEINITPFTDVLLVLLIIFMILAALITPPGFQKELPNKSSNPTTAQEQKKNIEVDVNDKGVVFVDGKRTDADHIYADMAEVAQRRGRLHVSIIADAKAPYGLIIRILDAAKLANLEDIGFVTS